MTYPHSPQKSMPPPHKNNASAQDLWSQLLARASEHPLATLEDPEYDPMEDNAKLRAALRNAGWSEAQIELRLEIDAHQVASAPNTSPGVNRRAEFIFGRLCDDVEAAMERLKMSSHTRVARGLEPSLGPHAAKTNVIMTEESIVTAGSQLFRFCGVVGRAFTRMILLAPPFWDEPGYSHEAGVRLLRTRPNLRAYWGSIFLSYALTGMHVLVPYKPSTISEIGLFEQVARAMELFAVAHEYGHHHLNHGRSVDADAAHREEFEADQFAMKICYEIDRYPVFGPNPYLTSGAGGLILLRAIKTLRAFERKLGGARKSTIDTHPDVAERAARFDSVALLEPAEFTGLKHFRNVSIRIMDVVDAEISPILERLTPASFPEFEHVRFE